MLLIKHAILFFPLFTFLFESNLVFSQKKGDTIKISPIRLSHYVNSSSHEYLPLPVSNGIIFSGMDRTGNFDFKIDFTKSKNAGGEDIYFSLSKNGVFEDALPINQLNTNRHEVATYVFSDGSLLISGNYDENMGPSIYTSIEGAATTDLFKAKKRDGVYRIIHYPEPLNSIYSEFDAISNKEESFIIFSSDRPGNKGQYHKKGWKWNDCFWGNTDIYISFRDGYEWTAPLNLGSKVNTPYAERTPWISGDLKRLYVSSNGFKSGKNDMDVYVFYREDINNWTNWIGPISLTQVNTDLDEWGYKIDNNDIQYFARSLKLNYEKNLNIDGGFRETNFRSNYKIYGAQSASFIKNTNTDIFIIPTKNTPIVTLSDVLFDFNSHKVKKSMLETIDNIADLCKQNPNKRVYIYGYTDEVGSVNYNNTLSQKRAQEIEKMLHDLQVQNIIISMGKGISENSIKGKTIDSKLKRRVEIYLD